MGYDEKAEVSIDADGNVLKCAKGADAAECGFVPGAKVCAKCGAVPVQMKMVPINEDFDDLYEKAASMAEMDMEDDEEDMEDESDEKGWGMGEDYMMPKRKKKKMKASMMAPDEEDMEDEDMEDESDEKGWGMDGDYMMPKRKKKMKGAMPKIEIEMGDDEDMDEEDMDDEEEDDEEMKGWGMGAPGDMEKMRKRRLQSLGVKAAEVGRNAYLCSIERKVYPGGAAVCADCPGGCVPEAGMPGLLHAEGIAETMFDGKVLDSGYSSDADMFVVDVEAKDGRAVEMFIDGTTSEVLGWKKLDENSFEQKSALDSMLVIDMSEAVEIAVKSIEGEAISVEPDIFEGFDAYAVEINGIDGKSYDVFVALDGEVLGYDKYEPEEAEAIEAEAAEIALKRAFTEDQRTAMAKEGNALPDGSFPIANESDLQNAIQAYGRAKDKEAAKRHIMKRAKELGKESMIPVNWLTGGAKMMEEKSGDGSDSFISSLVEFELLNSEIEGNGSDLS